MRLFFFSFPSNRPLPNEASGRLSSCHSPSPPPTKATQFPRFLIYFTTATTAAIPYVHPRLPDLTFSPILSFSRFVSDFSFPQEGGGGPDARIKITRTTNNFPSFLQSEEKKKKKERKETPSNNLDFCVCGKLFHPPVPFPKRKRRKKFCIIGSVLGQNNQ